MKDKKKPKILKKVILILIIILLIVLLVFGIKYLIKNKYKKILENNDVHNYEVVKTVDGVEEQTAYVRDNVMLLIDGENTIWLSKKEKESIIVNTERKTALIQTEDSAQIASLNKTYIEEYFENDDYKFKYLGKENDYYLLQFSNKNSLIVVTLYLNAKTNIVDKQVIENSVAKSVIEYKVKINSVSTEEVSKPDLTDYYIIEQ